MHTGFLALGGQTILDDRFELVNNGRVTAYINHFNTVARDALAGTEACTQITWYNQCDECEQADDVFSNGQGYLSPESDPAPWYDPLVPDSRKFFGVVGLEVQGAEDSTRLATVVTAMAGGGVVSALRFGPRTMVVRALAIAADDCGLEIGLNWLRCQYETTLDSCAGDYLWYLDCCPDCVPAPGSPTAAPCWADTYAEILTRPSDCLPDVWWPASYAELLNGPPAGHPEWCAWIENYYEMLIGLPRYACSSIECIEPHLRIFQNTRIVEGPTILRRQTMNSVGEIAEIEFTIVAADPHEYSPYYPSFNVNNVPTVPYNDPPAADPPEPDPFQPVPFPTRPVGQPIAALPLPTEWKRTVLPFEVPVTNINGSAVTRLTLQAAQQVGPLRIGVWADDELLDGFVVPFIPANATIDVNGQKRTVTSEYNGQSANRSGFLTGFGGTGSINWENIPVGAELELTIDQPTDDPDGQLGISLYAAVQGCA